MPRTGARPAKPPAGEAKPAEPHAARVAELESDIEILRSENAMLRARVEGLQTERDALAESLGKTGAPDAAAPELAEKNEKLAAAQAALTATLKESSQLVEKLLDTHARAEAMGADYVRAVVRINELEVENAILRGHRNPTHPH
jgi:chromosome segregation ATPase